MRDLITIFLIFIFSINVFGLDAKPNRKECLSHALPPNKKASQVINDILVWDDNGKTKATDAEGTFTINGKSCALDTKFKIFDGVKEYLHWIVATNIKTVRAMGSDPRGHLARERLLQEVQVALKVCEGIPQLKEVLSQYSNDLKSLDQPSATATGTPSPSK